MCELIAAVTQYAVEKVTQLGGRAVTLPDSNGTVYDPKGIDDERLAFVMQLKNVKRGRISEYVEKFKCEYHEGARPWGVKCDIALPCAPRAVSWWMDHRWKPPRVLFVMRSVWRDIFDVESLHSPR